tara:strand:- start:579 stop:860 length:282 start_codon:yes stop_codon:yes gene_type:complete
MTKINKYKISRVTSLSIVLNNNKIYNLISKVIGIELDYDSPIFREIEEYIVEKFEEMDDNRPTPACGFCGNDIDNDSIYCSYECSKADNTERV